ncbi:hypothetical protein [Breoghania sp. JC706]|uniref:hypothetical protein n=1 Tax=Breoghania sp. JC706 TaxID=3117732 RepID=UPI003007FB3B
MTVSGINFHVLDVGQGACNFVEILNEDGLVSHILLIDLGTVSTRVTAHDNIEWLKQQIEANNQYLDALIMTHGDNDHYNLIAKILPAFGPPDGNQIGMVRYGGPDWRYAAGKLIGTLGLYTGNIGGFTPSQTGYDPDEEEKWTPIWQTGPDADDVFLQLIIADVPHPHDPANLYTVKRPKMNGEAVNTKSVVMGLQWRNDWFVATGDATATTLGAVNDLLELETDPLPATLMMTMPHHGSRKTTYDLQKANNIPDFEARMVVGEFLDLFTPSSVSISADDKNFHHPSLYLTQQFSTKLNPATAPLWEDPELGGGYHFLTSWIDLAITPVFLEPRWPANWLYGTTKTAANVFCTYYFSSRQYNSENYGQYIAPPLPSYPTQDFEAQDDVPAGRNWQFSQDGHGFAVTSTPNPSHRVRAAAGAGGGARSAPPRSTTTMAGRAIRAAVPLDSGRRRRQ